MPLLFSTHLQPVAPQNLPYHLNLIVYLDLVVFFELLYEYRGFCSNSKEFIQLFVVEELKHGEYYLVALTLVNSIEDSSCFGHHSFNTGLLR